MKVWLLEQDQVADLPNEDGTSQLALQTGPPTKATDDVQDIKCLLQVQHLEGSFFVNPPGHCALTPRLAEREGAGVSTQNYAALDAFLGWEDEPKCNQTPTQELHQIVLHIWAQSLIQDESAHVFKNAKLLITCYSINSLSLSVYCSSRL